MVLVFPLVALSLGEVTVSIDAPAEVGEAADFIARVDIIDVTNLDACNYDVTYDPLILEVTDVTDGLIGETVVPADMWGFIPPATQGTIRVINNLPGLSGVSGSGYLAEIHFHVVGSAGNSSDITLSNGVLSDTSATEIPASWVGDSVHVNTALDAAFSASPLEGVAGVTEFTFTDETSGGTPPYTYEWDFGDGGSSTLQNPAHTYADAGTYTVSLTVTDSLLDGTINTETKTGYIKVYEPLDAEFTASPLEGVAGVTEFAFTDATTGGKAPYTYEWNFGDGGSSALQNPTHTYAGAGTYTVSLTVTDSLPTSDTETKTGYISAYNLGDANKDGSVNSLDITKLERIIVGLDEPTPGADANEDGNMDALDITRVELIIMGV